ncbi:Early light-induced protein, chloroplastic [Heracleum sosnowskyi]|uniref:Early light-induced protein, chloroplastic n=1 Tax=Heracleum sosnowskyi TaxID=360622 RepID=A0AAD8IN37_9APIA|nr:Early light-induced protein, chloroplastic [Heracleum sosnowskyi]
MASSVVMQSIIASPTTPAIIGRRLGVIPANYAFAPSMSRGASSLRIRCMAKDGQKEESIPKTNIPTPQPTPFKPPTPKVSTSFFDVLAFSGPAPERINGRLAMIGFVAAMAVEVSNGQDVFSQISNGGVPWFLGTSALLTLASLVPLFKGVSVQSKSGGLMTSDAEMWNGRFAMLGLVALAFTEYLKGSALV